MTAVVSCDHADGVGSVVLADHSQDNVLTRQLVDELIAADARLAEAGVSVAVLAAEGPAWCGGGDFKAKRLPGQPPAALELFAALENSPILWLAAIGAPALGVGINLAILCPRVLMADDAWMAVPGWSEGRFPGPLTAELGRIVGHRRALHMAMTEERIDARECVRIGLADEVVASADLMTRAHDQAHALTAAPPELRAAARRAWAGRHTNG